MRSLSSKNKSVKYLFYVIDVFAKYTWIKSSEDKKGKTVLNAFIKIANQSNSKPNRFQLDQGREFQSKLMQERLGTNDILMYLTDNKGDSVIAKIFIKTLKNKINKK